MRMLQGPLMLLAAALLVACSSDREDGEGVYRQLLGEGNPKIKVEEGKTYVFADGDAENPQGAGTEWFDFTGAPIPAADLQYGIGKDRIRSIDDPLFVSPDDPRLLEMRPSPYRKDEVPATNDEIRVVGYVSGGSARAYPLALLDRREVVNDQIAGVPVSVGW